MPPSPGSGCARILISISARYQERVRSPNLRLRTQIGYRYQNRVRSNSSYFRRLLPTVRQAATVSTCPRLDFGHIVRAPGALRRAPAMGSLPVFVRSTQGTRP